MKMVFECLTSTLTPPSKTKHKTRRKSLGTPRSFYLIGGGVNAVSIMKMVFECLTSTLTPPSKTKHKTRRKPSPNPSQREGNSAPRAKGTNLVNLIRDSFSLSRRDDKFKIIGQPINGNH